jgi:hypothetical protein
MNNSVSTLIIPVETQVREMDAKILLSCVAAGRIQQQTTSRRVQQRSHSGLAQHQGANTEQTYKYATSGSPQ